eukprot:IDg7963t1
MKDERMVAHQRRWLLVLQKCDDVELTTHEFSEFALIEDPEDIKVQLCAQVSPLILDYGCKNPSLIVKRTSVQNLKPRCESESAHPRLERICYLRLLWNSSNFLATPCKLKLKFLNRACKSLRTQEANFQCTLSIKIPRLERVANASESLPHAVIATFLERCDSIPKST